jgi:hypothetical protein
MGRAFLFLGQSGAQVEPLLNVRNLALLGRGWSVGAGAVCQGVGAFPALGAALLIALFRPPLRATRTSQHGFDLPALGLTASGQASCPTRPAGEKASNRRRRRALLPRTQSGSRGRRLIAHPESGQSLAHPQAVLLHRQIRAGKPGKLRGFATGASAGQPKYFFAPTATPARHRWGTVCRHLQSESSWRVRSYTAGSGATTSGCPLTLRHRGRIRFAGPARRLLSWSPCIAGRGRGPHLVSRLPPNTAPRRTFPRSRIRPKRSHEPA